MTDYAVYVESGPLQRKTMVHVFDLLGCIARGATTAEALQETPAAIQAFLEFEAKHSGSSAAAEPINIHVVEHVSQGPWLGYGDPVSGFTPDFDVLSFTDLQTYLRRLKLMEEDLLTLAGKIPLEQRAQTPANGGRSANAILVNLGEGHACFLRYILGKMDEISARMRAVRREPAALLENLAAIWEIANLRMAELNETERNLRVQHGQVTWTMRRAIRRMLEVTWDFSGELANTQKDPV